MKLDRALLGEIARFGAVGGLATLTHGGIYLALVSAGAASPQAANLLAFLVAVAVSFLGHGFVTFPDRERRRNPWASAVRQLVVSLAGLGLNAGAVFWVDEVAEADSRLAVLFMLFVTPVLTFLASRFWAYRM